MKRFLTLLLVLVLAFSIFAFLSPVAYALQIIGDPVEGNSFSQQFAFDESDGQFDQFEVSLDGGQFTDQGISIDSDWATDQISDTLISATFAPGEMSEMSASAQMALSSLFGSLSLSFQGSLIQTFCMTLSLFLEGNLTNIIQLIYHDGSWHFSQSVPDADIMLLLGPALIGLGLIGRKKYRTVR
jgi:ABC-type dipeptide/oligopeptide/nickel transport system permease component